MAARRGTPTALQWAHCIGLSLLGVADGDVTPPPPRRRPRRWVPCRGPGRPL